MAACRARRDRRWFRAMPPDDVVFLGGANPPGGDGPGGLPGEPGDALKERAASALERALGFVTAKGDALALRRAHVALQAEPSAGYAEMLAAAQNDDGSFAPFDAPSAGWLGRELAERGSSDTFAGTLQALALHADVRQDNAPHVEAACRFLEARQAEDGSFALREGGSEEDTIFATALAAGSLGRSHFARPEHLAAAGGWLDERWSPDRIEGGRYGELVAFAVYYSNVPDDRADEALQWCGRELEKGFRSHALESLQVMQVLLACQAGSLPGASFAPEELLERLLSEQAGDGGFDALCVEGAAWRVGPTIDAMRAIIGLCATF